MTTPNTTDRMEEAREVFEAKLDSMCMTWDHSFGLMNETQREGLRRRFRQVGEHEIIPAIATALFASEAKGRQEERERIVAALEYEASVTPCAEDAMVTRSNATLIRADFSYEEAERLSHIDEAK